MSYARFGEGKAPSDVYVIRDGVTGNMECLACKLTPPNFTCASLDEMYQHIVAHRKAGHNVPQRAIRRLRKEMEEG